MKIENQYRADVDGLRAIAILSVILFHYFPKVLSGGFVGVDIFFVISGYLITSIIIKDTYSNKFSFFDFYAKRIRRIFPALLVVLIFCFVYGWNELLAIDYKLLGKHIASSAVFITNIVLYNETGYFDTVSELKPLLHLWSLGVEEQFYIFWPLILWALHNKKKLYINLISIVFIVSFIVNLWLSKTDEMAAFYLPYGRFWELMSGAIIANLHIKRGFIKNKLINNLQSLLGIILITLAVTLLNNKLRYPYLYALLPVGGAFLIINSSPLSFINNKILSSKILVYVGLISYPLYLWHWPLISFYKLTNGDETTLFGKVGLIALSFLLASLTYHLIEKRIRNGIHLYIKVYTLLVLMIIVGYVGYNDYMRDGLDFRVKHIVSDFTNTQFNLKTSWREHECFLLDNEKQFSDKCISDGNGELIVVYGDSFAASLSPGLANYLDKIKYRFGQLTTSGCPPLLPKDSVSERCMNANQSALNVIKNKKPFAIILESHWNAYSLSKIPNLISELHSYGIHRVEIVGILPKWQGSLPRVYFRYYKKFHRPLPQVTNYGLAMEDIKDNNIEKVATDSHAIFFSAYKILCNAEGCLTRVGDGKGEITTLDDAHLTPAASEFIVNSLLSKLIN